MRTIRPNSQAGRLLMILVERWPEWSNVEHFGRDGYSSRNRMDDALGVRGFKIDRRRLVRDEGFPGTEQKTRLYEWRFLTEEIFHCAALLVRSWRTGEDYDRLARAVRDRREREAADAKRQPSLFD